MQNGSKKTYLVAIVLALCVIFIWDINSAKGFSVWIWYFIPVYLSAKAGGRYFVWSLAGLIAFLMVVAWQLSPPGLDPQISMSRRLMGMSAFCLMAWLVEFQKRAEEKNLKHIRRAISAVSACNHVLMRATDEKQLLQEICQKITDPSAGNYQLAWVGFAIHDLQKNVQVVASSGVDAGYLAKVKITWAETDIYGNGPVGIAIRSGQVFVSNDFKNDYHTAPWQQEAAKCQLAACIAVPLKNADQSFGVLTIYASEPGAFKEDEISVLKELGNDLALGLHNLRIRAKNLETERDLMRLAAIVNSSDDAIISNTLTGIITSWNQGAEQIYGYSAAEAVGQSLLFLFPPECEKEKLAMQELIPRGESVRHYETQQVCKDGKKIQIMATFSPILGEGGKIIGISKIARDVSTLKLVERYQTLAGDVLAILNQPGTMPELIQRVLMAVKESTRSAAVGIRLQSGEDFPYVVQDGFSREFLLHENSLIARDVKGGHCRDSEGRMKLECTCGLVLGGKTDPANPIFTPGGSCWLNNSFPLLELPADSDPRFHPRNRCIHDNYASVALVPIRKKEKIIGLLQINDHRKNHFTATCIQILEGIAAHIGEALIQRESEQIRQEMELQLRQAQKLESIGQLAAGIAHEINTPTQYIGDNTRFLADAFKELKPLLTLSEQLVTAPLESQPGLLEELRSAAKGADCAYLCGEIPQAIQQSIEGVERVTRIVQAMKEFSHPSGAEKSLVDLNHAIEVTIAVSRNEWKYVADMETDFAPGLPLVPCLPGEFNQVILNLVVNAAHTIAEVVGKSSTKGRISISTRLEKDWVEVRVKDTGKGIPETVRPHIFEPFFTTKGVGKGTGQGLAIVRSVIVKKHGGTIHFETEVGQGTTFVIRLPLAAVRPEGGV